MTPVRRRFPGVLTVVVAAAFVVLLAAGCGGDPKLSADPDKIDIGDGEIGKRSPAQQLEVANEDRDEVTIERITIERENSSSFVLSDTSECAEGMKLGKDDSCTVAVQLFAESQGKLDATLVIEYSSDESPLEVELRGQGVGEPAVTVGANKLDLGDVAVGEGPRTKNTSLTNSGNAPLELDSIRVEGDPDFVVAKSTTCSTSAPLPAGESCTLAVAFSAEEMGARSATLIVEHNASGSPTQIALTGNGTGNPKAQISPTSLSFGQVALGKTSSKSTTLSSTGKAPLEVVRVGLEGPNDEDFTFSGCAKGTVLDPGETCSIKVTFKPVLPGARSATLVVQTNASSTPKEISLSGTGQAPPEPTPTTEG
jgi:hypothetical protein